MNLLLTRLIHPAACMTVLSQVVLPIQRVRNIPVLLSCNL